MAAQAAPRHTAPTPGGLCPWPPYSGQVRKPSCLPSSCKIRTIVLSCRHDAKVSPGSGPPAPSSSLEPAAYVCTGGVQRDSPSGSVWGMFPQAHNPPRKGGTRANAVSRQALWSHTAPPRFITVSLRLHYGSSQLSYGFVMPLLRLRAWKPRNPADTRNEYTIKGGASLSRAIPPPPHSDRRASASTSV